MSPPEFDLQLDSVDPAQFAQFVAIAPQEQLVELMASELRRTILDTIFDRMQTQYDPAKSAGLDVVLHFLITAPDGSEPDKYQVKTQDGVCVTGDQLTEDAGMTLTLDAADFLKMTAGAVGSTALYIGGKLKVDGNIMMGIRIMQHFTIPQADGLESAGSTAQGDGGTAETAATPPPGQASAAETADSSAAGGD